MKLNKNLALITAIKNQDLEKVRELLDDKTYMDLCADVNY